jgi:transcription initiation factor TFIID subunit 1
MVVYLQEEYPPIMSNVGMGSLLVNYYRKTSSEDDTVPQLDTGEPFVMEPSDASPFMNFGDVQPGQTVPTLYNLLIRAPVFRHDPPATDFLLIKQTILAEDGRKQVRWYMRDIPNLYVIGQTFPVQEVPGPHSRKITATVKNRLQVVSCHTSNHTTPS